MNIFKLFLVIHIIAGTIGLIAGTVNIIRKKGDKPHRLVGNLFFYNMLAVAVSAFVLSIIHSNYFLFIVGVFTFYMVASGQRYLFLKIVLGKPKPQIIDWAIALFMLLFGLAFIVFGILNLIKSNSFAIVFFVFGFIGLRFVWADYNNFKGNNLNKNFTTTAHIQRMCGAYIASLTAFLVVNNTLLPNYIAWLLPSALVTPLIFKWVKKYKYL